MKTATKRKTKSPATFEEEYRSALGEYARGGGEAALARAYELGRGAITEKKSLMEIASMPQQALQERLAEAQGAARHQDVLSVAGEFLAEIVSPNQTEHSGGQDSMTRMAR